MQGSSPGVRAGHASVNIGTKASHGTKIDLKIRLVFLRNVIPYSVFCAIDAHLFCLKALILRCSFINCWLLKRDLMCFPWSAALFHRRCWGQTLLQ